MRCATEVVRIETAEGSNRMVALTIRKIRFATHLSVSIPAVPMPADLESMTPVTPHLN